MRAITSEEESLHGSAIKRNAYKVLQSHKISRGPKSASASGWSVTEIAMGCVCATPTHVGQLWAQRGHRFEMLLKSLRVMRTKWWWSYVKPLTGPHSSDTKREEKGDWRSSYSKRNCSNASERGNRRVMGESCKRFTTWRCGNFLCSITFYVIFRIMSRVSLLLLYFTLPHQRWNLFFLVFIQF